MQRPQLYLVAGGLFMLAGVIWLFSRGVIGIVFIAVGAMYLSLARRAARK